MKVDINLLDFENINDIEVVAYYNSAVFSGIAFEEINGHYYEYPYENGKEHGEVFGINKKLNKVIVSENYNNGVLDGECFAINKDKGFEKKETYSNGKLVKQKIYNLHNTLLKEVDIENDIEIEFYDDGSLFREKKITGGDTIKKEFFYLGSKERCIATNLGYNSEMKGYNFNFNTELIFQNINKLNSKFHLFPIVWFIKDLLNKKRAVDFLIELSKNEDDYFKSEAVFFMGLTNDKKCIPYLQKLTNNKNKPSRNNRFEFSGSFNHLTIGERAKKSIIKINTSEEKNEVG